MAEIDRTIEAFQKTLKERKAEFNRNAEEKRLEGLKQIRDRKSRIGIHPLEQFPKEIWAKLLEDLCPEDRLSMREVHPLFRDLTEDHLIRDILFPLAISVGSILPEKRLSGRYPIGTAEEILNLRSVSMTLKNSIDKWIEFRILEDMRQEGNPWYLPRFNFAITSDMNWINRVLAFSREPGPLDRRPKLFVLRALEIELWPEYWRSRNYSFMQPRAPPEEERRETLQRCFMILRNNVIETLEAVGDQVMFFQLTCQSMEELEDLGLDLPQIYSFLRECLLLMRNVKWLKLHASGLKCLPIQTNWKSSARVALQNHPMPTLAALERVDLEVETTLDRSHASQVFPIWDCILEANPQVKYFTCHDDIHGNRYDHYLRQAVLSLDLETVRVGILDLQFLRRISQCNWNLKQLELKVSGLDFGLNSILQFVNKFPALEDLSLSINQINFVGEIVPLGLPNLRKLKVNIGPVVKLSTDECLPFFFSLQFIFQCVQLRELVWNNLINDSSKLRPLLGEPPGNIMDFQGGLVDLRGSNLWDAFPALRRVEVKFREMNNTLEVEYCTRVYRNRKLFREDDREWNVEYNI